MTIVQNELLREMKVLKGKLKDMKTMNQGAAKDTLNHNKCEYKREVRKRIINFKKKVLDLKKKQNRKVSNRKSFLKRQKLLFSQTRVNINNDFCCFSSVRL